jgi:hypothetical protein
MQSQLVSRTGSFRLCARALYTHTHTHTHTHNSRACPHAPLPPQTPAIPTSLYPLDRFARDNFFRAMSVRIDSPSAFTDLPLEV